MNHDIHTFIESEKAQSFIKANDSYVLANIFIPDADKEQIDIGLYNDEKEVMKTLTEEGVETSSDIAKTGNDIKELEITEDVLSLNEAVTIAKKDVDTEKPYKRVLGVLQNPGEVTWTITLITIDYTVYTLKIHGVTGNIKDVTTNNMMSWIKSA